MKTEKEILELIETVRQTAYELHVYLGNGYLEKVYENALKNRLVKKGIEVKTQVPLKVHDEDGSLIGDYQADMLVEGELIVELKATKMLAAEHYAQTMNYLKTTGLRYALLINFGSYKFEVRRIVSTFQDNGKKPCREIEPCRDVENVEGESGAGRKEPCRDVENVENISMSATQDIHSAAGPESISSTRSPYLHGQTSCAAGPESISSTRSTFLHG